MDVKASGVVCPHGLKKNSFFLLRSQWISLVLEMTVMNPDLNFSGMQNGALKRDTPDSVTETSRR